jgi:hypothetical protein
MTTLHQTTEINIADAADLETKLLQITTNVKVNPPYIKAPPPTPLNVKVHKHPKWNKTPYPINRNQNTSPQLPNFPQNQHQKFPPQYCYYTDGSFIPPKKLSENIWEPARVGYGIWNPLLKINISKRLIGLQNILRVEILAIYLTPPLVEFKAFMIAFMTHFSVYSFSTMNSPKNQHISLQIALTPYTL